MADNYGFAKLTKDYFDNVLKKLDPKMTAGEAKPFYELHNLFGVIEDLEEPAFEEMRTKLDLAVRAIKKLLTDKSVKGKPIEPAFKKLLANVQKANTAVVKAERDYESAGAGGGLIQVDISVNARDFYNHVVESARVDLTIDAKPSPVKVGQMMVKGSARFRGIMVEATGNIHVELTMRRKVFPKLSQNIGYKNISGKVLLIEATEEATTVEVTDSSGKKAVDSKGIKGELGVDFKVFSTKGEVTTSREFEESTGQERKFTIYSPKGTLVLKQG